MSTLAVTLERAKNVRKHPDADRLILVDILGWTVVTQPGIQEDDLVIYFPIDSVLPAHLEAHIFSADSKVKLAGGRIKTIRLRGEYSQGLVVPFHEARTWPWLNPPNFALQAQLRVGDDLTAVLGVTKYESPLTARRARALLNKQTNATTTTSDLQRYTDLEHLAKHPDSFIPGETVAVTEKLHGTSARYGWVRPQPQNWWQRVYTKLGIPRRWQFVYGSRNVEYTDLERPSVYRDCAISTRVADPKLGILQRGEQVFGEIVGPSIQKGYTYGWGSPKFFVYDVKIGDRFLTHDELVTWCAMRKLDMVPVLYVGPYMPDLIARLAQGRSVLDSRTTPVREGVVVRRALTGSAQRMVRKVVSKDFLLRNAEDGGTEHDELVEAAAQ